MEDFAAVVAQAFRAHKQNLAAAPSIAASTRCRAIVSTAMAVALLSDPLWILSSVLGDRGYDAAAIRRGLRARHIVPSLAMRRTRHVSGLGRWRWVVERTLRG
jgi:hypothetical protein